MAVVSVLALLADVRAALEQHHDWASEGVLAEARKTRTADWNPIGAPRSHTRAKITAALSL